LIRALIGLVWGLVGSLIFLAMWGIAAENSTVSIIVLVALLLAYAIAGIIELRAWLHWRDFEKHATQDEKDECSWWIMAGRGRRAYM
jgi:drug/metabolite transporter (DMT)-like permease